jgi:hypothetical protein
VALQATQERGVLEAGLAAIRPVLDVMTLQKDPMGAPGVGTRLDALAQRALERAGNCPALAPDRQRHAVFVFDHLDHAGVTAEPPRSLRGEERLAHLSYLDQIGFV